MCIYANLIYLLSFLDNATWLELRECLPYCLVGLQISVPGQAHLTLIVLMWRIG